MGGSLHTRHTHLEQWTPCVHKVCTLHVQLVHVVMSPCNLLPQQANMSSADFGLKKDDIHAGAPPEAEALGMEGVGIGIVKEETPTLRPADFVTGLGDPGMKDVRAIGLPVSDRIGSGVQAYSLIPIRVPYPKWMHKKTQD